MLEISLNPAMWAPHASNDSLAFGLLVYNHPEVEYRSYEEYIMIHSQIIFYLLQDGYKA